MPEHNPFDLTGRVIIVTGAAGLLGSGYMDHLHRVGAKAVGWDHNIGDNRVGSICQTVDITDEESVRLAVEHTMGTYGRVDGLLNNAAMNPSVGSDEARQQFVPYEEYDIALFRRELDVNLTGMMICMKHIAPVMMRQKSGSIVNVASGVALDAHDHRVYAAGETKFKSPAYVASKTAVLGLTRQWAARLGSHNIRVNAISIGGVARPDTPSDFVQRYSETSMLGRMALPGEYCATMQYLLSDASAFMTGSNLIIDGGKSAW